MMNTHLAMRLIGARRRSTASSGRHRGPYLDWVSAAQDDLSLPLEALIARFAEMMRRVGARYGLSGADADELVQEVRISLWRARGTPEALAELNASYVYRAASTAALMILRRRRSGVRAERLDTATSVAAVDPRPGPAAAIETSEFTERLERALATLADPRQLAVRLHLVGYGLADIAALASWSEAKARNLVYRGLADLRRELARDGIGLEVTE